MAERRMFAKTIVLSDAFLDMPLSARCLYFTLGMLADDDGFVNSPKAIMRQAGASNDDLNLILAKRFILSFESGVIVIKHWRIHNYIQKDRYRSTKYINEMAAITVDEKGAYTECIQPVSTLDTQDRLELESELKQELVEDSVMDYSQANVSNKRTMPPTLEEVQAYCDERGNNVDAVRFIDYYTANGWKVGKNKMKDWKAAVRTWERSTTQKKSTGNPFLDMLQED